MKTALGRITHRHYLLPCSYMESSRGRKERGLLLRQISLVMEAISLLFTLYFPRDLPLYMRQESKRHHITYLIASWSFNGRISRARSSGVSANHNTARDPPCVAAPDWLSAYVTPTMEFLHLPASKELVTTSSYDPCILLEMSVRFHGKPLRSE